VDARLVIVGDGEERPALVELAARLRLDGAVQFVGAQPRKAVAAYLSAADVFLFPTERDEAAPLVLPQALACGLPVVASRRGGIPEVVDRPGENGILVEPGSLEELVRAMLDLHRDEGLRASLGANAVARVAEAYTLERMVERTLEVYAAAANHGPADARATLRTRNVGLIGPPLLLHRAFVHAAIWAPFAHHLHL
jgi:glycosyltransferase involved in cell wall biosynthesis